ncbi:hypothetical protein KUH03_15240 [Sphingobacterium sp. E70]|nr:hypothetical protein [Sphingobacterium sp. E70]ULT27865.1 hypothetical protein KUH03_15240 [Sphingobacterium sp. E70]
MYFSKIENYIANIGYNITHKDEKEGVFVIENEDDGIRNLIVGIAQPIIIFEQYLFTINNENMDMFKSLLIKNRDIIHGGFALTEDGKRSYSDIPCKYIISIKMNLMRLLIRSVF